MHCVWSLPMSHLILRAWHCWPGNPHQQPNVKNAILMLSVLTCSYPARYLGSAFPGFRSGYLDACPLHPCGNAVGRVHVLLGSVRETRMMRARGRFQHLLGRDSMETEVL